MTGEPWLVVVDAQNVFADPASPWAAPRFAEIVPVVQRLITAYAPRVVFTRFVAPTQPTGAWVDYYADWPFALAPPDSDLYAIVPELAGHVGHVETRTTFGKWDAGLDAATEHSGRLVLVGVSTDCCVLTTALGAADAGVQVEVIVAGCAGASDPDHERALAAMELFAPLITVDRSTSGQHS